MSGVLALAGVLAALGATADEADHAYTYMHTWELPRTPGDVIRDCERALAMARAARSPGGGT